MRLFAIKKLQAFGSAVICMGLCRQPPHNTLSAGATKFCGDMTLAGIIGFKNQKQELQLASQIERLITEILGALKILRVVSRPKRIPRNPVKAGMLTSFLILHN
jgi:hypothetical protein